MAHFTLHILLILYTTLLSINSQATSTKQVNLSYTSGPMVYSTNTQNITIQTVKTFTVRHQITGGVTNTILMNPAVINSEGIPVPLLGFSYGYQVTGLPSWGSYSSTTNAITLNPPKNFSGLSQITISYSDFKNNKVILKINLTQKTSKTWFDFSVVDSVNRKANSATLSFPTFSSVSLDNIQSSQVFLLDLGIYPWTSSIKLTKGIQGMGQVVQKQVQGNANSGIFTQSFISTSQSNSFGGSAGSFSGWQGSFSGNNQQGIISNSNTNSISMPSSIISVGSNSNNYNIPQNFQRSSSTQSTQFPNLSSTASTSTTTTSSGFKGYALPIVYQAPISKVTPYYINGTQISANNNQNIQNNLFYSSNNINSNTNQVSNNIMSKSLSSSHSSPMVSVSNSNYLNQNTKVEGSSNANTVSQSVNTVIAAPPTVNGYSIIEVNGGPNQGILYQYSNTQNTKINSSVNSMPIVLSPSQIPVINTPTVLNNQKQSTISKSISTTTTTTTSSPFSSVPLQNTNLNTASTINENNNNLVTRSNIVNSVSQPQTTISQSNQPILITPQPQPIISSTQTPSSQTVIINSTRIQTSTQNPIINTFQNNSQNTQTSSIRQSTGNNIINTNHIIAASPQQQIHQVPQNVARNSINTHTYQNEGYNYLPLINIEEGSSNGVSNSIGASSVVTNNIHTINNNNNNNIINTNNIISNNNNNYVIESTYPNTNTQTNTNNNINTITKTTTYQTYTPRYQSSSTYLTQPSQLSSNSYNTQSSSPSRIFSTQNSTHYVQLIKVPMQSTKLISNTYNNNIVPIINNNNNIGGSSSSLNLSPSSNQNQNQNVQTFKYQTNNAGELASILSSLNISIPQNLLDQSRYQIQPTTLSQSGSSQSLSSNNIGNTNINNINSMNNINSINTITNNNTYSSSILSPSTSSSNIINNNIIPLSSPPILTQTLISDTLPSPIPILNISNISPGFIVPKQILSLTTSTISNANTLNQNMLSNTINNPNPASTVSSMQSYPSSTYQTKISNVMVNTTTPSFVQLTPPNTFNLRVH